MCFSPLLTSFTPTHPTPESLPLVLTCRFTITPWECANSKLHCRKYKKSSRNCLECCKEKKKISLLLRCHCFADNSKFVVWAMNCHFLSFQTVLSLFIKTSGDIPNNISKILPCLGKRGKVIWITLLLFFWLVKIPLFFVSRFPKPECNETSPCVWLINYWLSTQLNRWSRLRVLPVYMLEFKMWTDGMENLLVVEWTWRWAAERGRHSCFSAAQLLSNYFLTICSVSTYFSSFNNFAVALENSPAVKHRERWEEVLNTILMCLQMKVHSSV